MALKKLVFQTNLSMPAFFKHDGILALCDHSLKTFCARYDVSLQKMNCALGSIATGCRLTCISLRRHYGAQNGLIEGGRSSPLTLERQSSGGLQ